MEYFQLILIKFPNKKFNFLHKSNLLAFCFLVSDHSKPNLEIFWAVLNSFKLTQNLVFQDDFSKMSSPISRI